jgi:hypothetical protein
LSLLHKILFATGSLELVSEQPISSNCIDIYIYIYICIHTTCKTAIHRGDSQGSDIESLHLAGLLLYEIAVVWTAANVLTSEIFIMCMYFSAGR